MRERRSYKTQKGDVTLEVERDFYLTKRGGWWPP